MSRGERKAMIVRYHPALSLSRQCEVLSIKRSSFYHAAEDEGPENLALMRRIDELYQSKLMVTRRGFPYLEFCDSLGPKIVILGAYDDTCNASRRL